MKFLKTLTLSALVGATTAYFLTSKKGQELKEKALDAYKDYQADPEGFQQDVKERVTDYTAKASQTVKDYKEKVQSGQLTTDDILATVKEKAAQAGDFVQHVVADVQEQFQADQSISGEADSEFVAEVDDIIIDYPEADLAESILVDDPEEENL